MGHCSKVFPAHPKVAENKNNGERCEMGLQMNGRKKERTALTASTVPIGHPLQTIFTLVTKLLGQK